MFAWAGGLQGLAEASLQMAKRTSSQVDRRRVGRLVRRAMHRKSRVMPTMVTCGRQEVDMAPRLVRVAKGVSRGCWARPRTQQAPWPKREARR